MLRAEEPMGRAVRARRHPFVSLAAWQMAKVSPLYHHCIHLSHGWPCWPDRRPAIEHGAPDWIFLSFFLHLPQPRMWAVVSFSTPSYIRIESGLDRCVRHLLAASPLQPLFSPAMLFAMLAYEKKLAHGMAFSCGYGIPGADRYSIHVVLKVKVSDPSPSIWDLTDVAPESQDGALCQSGSWSWGARRCVAVGCCTWKVGLGWSWEWLSLSLSLSLSCPYHTPNGSGVKRIENRFSRSWHTMNF